MIVIVARKSTIRKVAELRWSGRCLRPVIAAGCRPGSCRLPICVANSGKPSWLTAAASAGWSMATMDDVRGGSASPPALPADELLRVFNLISHMGAISARMNSISGIPRPLKISLHKRTKLEQNASRYVWAKAANTRKWRGSGFRISSRQALPSATRCSSVLPVEADRPM